MKYFIAYAVLFCMFYSMQSMQEGADHKAHYNNLSLVDQAVKRLSQEKETSEITLHEMHKEFLQLTQKIESQLNASIQITKQTNDSLKNQYAKALGAAQNNVISSKKHLSFLGNTARRNQLLAGIFAITFGLTKGIYDLVQFTTDIVDPTTNIFSVLTDASLCGGGLYALKLSLQNNQAKSAHNEAQVLYYLVQASQPLDPSTEEKARTTTPKTPEEYHGHHEEYDNISI